MRQYLYTSRSTEVCREPALDAILEVSRHNNALEGLSGLLWANGTSFLQVLEGDDQAVSSLIDRLIKDPRHRDMVPLVDRKIETREFGYWARAMPHRVKAERSSNTAYTDSSPANPTTCAGLSMHCLRCRFVRLLTLKSPDLS